MENQHIDSDQLINLIEEIALAIRLYDVDFIGFVDDNMMVSKKRIFEFCDLIQERDLSFFWGCHGRVTNAELPVLERMAESGCVWIGYGIESGARKF